MKLLKVGKFIVKGLALVGGGVAMVADPITGSIAGIVAIASAFSSMFKDKNFKPLMKLVNLFAVNIDNAENDKKINGIVKKK